VGPAYPSAHTHLPVGRWHAPCPHCCSDGEIGHEKTGMGQSCAHVLLASQRGPLHLSPISQTPFPHVGLRVNVNCSILVSCSNELVKRSFRYALNTPDGEKVRECSSTANTIDCVPGVSSQHVTSTLDTDFVAKFMLAAMSWFKVVLCVRSASQLPNATIWIATGQSLTPLHTPHSSILPESQHWPDASCRAHTSKNCIWNAFCSRKDQQAPYHNVTATSIAVQ
jgi:hypothetical protein